MELQTPRLTLVLDSPDAARERIAAMDASDRAQLSADWLARLEAATAPDPWVHGFSMSKRECGTPVGGCGFKCPPDTENTVEIAYYVDPDHQCQGYATEAALALVDLALARGVSSVRAHTLPEPNASGRVLTKSGFRFVGEVIDPEDGPVWRWERP